MYYLLNPKGKPKTKKKTTRRTASKARSSSRRGTGTKKSSRRRKNPTRSKSSMAKKTKKRVRRKAKRRVVRRRKPTRARKPVRRKVRRKKARRNPVKRRKAVRRKAKRVYRRKRKTTRRKAKRRVTRAKRTYKRKRKATKRRRTYRKNPAKMKLGNFLPNMKELPEVLKTGAMVMGGWAACAATAGLVGNQVNKLIGTMGFEVYGEDGQMNHAPFWIWQGVDAFIAFGIAGVAGMTLGKDARNMVLLGGSMRIVWHVANKYLPEAAKPYVLADAPGVGDWITASDVGRLPSPAVGDYITRSSMPVGSYAY